MELRRRGLPIPEREGDATHVAIGVNHAFASPTGRLNLVNSIGGLEREDGPPVNFADLSAEMQALFAPGTSGYEWVMLAGLPLDLRTTGINVHTHRKAGIEYARSETELGKILAGRDTSVPLDVAVAASDLEIVWDDLCAVCASGGVSPGRLVEAITGCEGRAGIRQLLQALPTFGLLQDLRIMRHANPQQPWRPNDRQDLLALSVAVVHCDAVVTERHWTHLCVRLDTQARFGTTVTATLSNMLDRLVG